MERARARLYLQQALSLWKCQPLSTEVEKQWGLASKDKHLNLVFFKIVYAIKSINVWGVFFFNLDFLNNFIYSEVVDWDNFLIMYDVENSASLEPVHQGPHTFTYANNVARGSKRAVRVSSTEKS